MENQMNSNEVPFSADVFKIVQVVQIDGKSIRVPVQIVDESIPVPTAGRQVLHIVMSNHAFCAWRGN